MLKNLKYDQNLNAISNIMIEITSGYSILSSTSTTLLSNDLTSVDYPSSNSASTIIIDQNDLSDLVYNEDSYQQLTLSTNSSGLIPLDLTCSVNGLTIISSTLVIYPGNSLPAWVTLNSVGNSLVINTNGTNSGTTSTFYVTSTISSYSINKMITLKVNDWSDTNWTIWEALDYKDCKTCKSQFSLKLDPSLSGNYWVKQSSSSSNSSSSTNTSVSNNSYSSETTASQAIAGTAIGVSMVLSMWNLNVPQGLWMTLNQFQLILLLLFTKSNIPEKVVNYLSGLKGTTCSLNFIPFKDIPVIDQLMDSFDYNLRINELSYFGLFSGSTLVNNLSIVWVFIILAVFLIIIVIATPKVKAKLSSKPKIIKIIDNIYQFFAFSIFIRLFMQSSQFIMIWSISEMYFWYDNGTYKILSIIASIIVCILLWLLIGLSAYNFHRFNSIRDPKSNFYLKEFTVGLKPKKKAWVFPLFILLRRAIFVIILIWGNTSLNHNWIISLMIVVQLVYFITIVLIRPNEDAKNNFIEITNEMYFFILVCILTYYNSSENWESGIETAYMYIIMSNSAVVILIMIGKITFYY